MTYRLKAYHRKLSVLNAQRALARLEAEFTAVVQRAPLRGRALVEHAQAVDALERQMQLLKLNSYKLWEYDDDGKR